MLNLIGTMTVILLVGPLLLIGVAGLLLLAAAILPSEPRRVRETFRCPWTHKLVTADFVVPESAVNPSEVATCTAFPDPERIACAKACRELADVGWGLSRGVFPRWALISGGVVTWRSGATPA